MKQYPLTTAVLVLFTALLPRIGSADAQDPAPAGPGIFYPSRLQIARGGIAHPTQFASAGVCAGCHTEIVSQWDGSMHSRAHPDPLYLSLSRLASRETQGLTDRFCAGCHTPLAVASGEVPPVGDPFMSRTGQEGVTCDFCHVVDKSTGTGNLPAVLDPGPNKRGPRSDASSPFHKTSYLKLATQAEFCGLCHDVSHPLNNLPIERTYTEWKEGPYNSAEASRRVYCQDCHMRQRPSSPATGQTIRPDSRGKAAAMGPWRDHVYTHWFVGGNVALPSLFGSAAHSNLARERLRAAATLEILGAQKDGGFFRWRVRVTNSGAGHYLPTGLTEVRQMWVETTVRSADGQLLFSSGGLDVQGEIDPAAVVYRTVLGTAAGKPTAKVWEATQVLTDRRIAPRQHDDLSYEAKYDRNWTVPLTVTARLLYRSYPPSLAGLFPEAGLAAAEPVEMNAVETSANLR